MSTPLAWTNRANETTESYDISDASFNIESHLNLQRGFCDNDNINHCIAYLGQELESLGLSPLNSKTSNGSIQCDKVHLINTIYNLLKLRSTDAKQKEELEDRFNRLQFDYELLQKEINRFRDKIELAERNLQTQKESSRQISIKNKTLQGHLKTERDETKRLQLIIHQRDAQFHHEIRRKERETSILKEQLHHALSDKGVERRLGMTISNVIPRAGGQRGKWQTKTSSQQNDEDFHKKVLCSYENRTKLLTDDNVSLRETLKKFFSYLSALDTIEGNEENGEIKEIDLNAVSSETDLVSKLLQLPCCQMPTKLESMFDEKTISLRAKLSRGRNGVDCEETQRLRNQIEEYEALIQNQRLKGALDLNNGNIELEKKNLSAEKMNFLQMKDDFQKEKRVFSEVAVRLSKDRQDFATEKKEFMEWKANQESLSRKDATFSPISLKAYSPVAAQDYLDSPSSSVNRPSIVQELTPDFNNLLLDFQNLTKNDFNDDS